MLRAVLLLNRTFSLGALGCVFSALACRRGQGSFKPMLFFSTIESSPIEVVGVDWVDAEF